MDAVTNEEPAALVGGEQSGLQLCGRRSDRSFVFGHSVALPQDKSAEGCKETAMDADGTPCEFCFLQEAFQQTTTDEQFGLDCDTTVRLLWRHRPQQRRLMNSPNVWSTINKMIASIPRAPGATR